MMTSGEHFSNDALHPETPVDLDSTGPLPTEEMRKLQRQVIQKVTAADYMAALAPDTDDDSETTPDAVEPAHAPGWEGIPVETRLDSESESGSDEFLSWGSRTDVGLVREHNEDAILVHAPLFGVCDGMGGHAAGEVASAIAVDTIATHIPDTADDILLGVAVERANTAVIQAAQEGLGKPGMGCTATAVMIDKSHMAIAHVGDSRVYVLHAGTLVRVTHDHSFVEELVDAGEITIGEARLHPNRSVITRALGSDPNMYADHFTLDVETNDRIIICSDGLSSMLSDSQIESISVSSVTPQGAADNLVADALAEGGHDNISVIVVDILDDGTHVEHRRKLLRSTMGWMVATFTVILLLVLASLLVYNHSYYLAAEGDAVAIYQGFQGELFGRSLSRLVDLTDVALEDLPESLQNDLESGIYIGGLSEAQATVDSYREQIEEDRAYEEQIARSAVSSTTSDESDDGTGEESSEDASVGEGDVSEGDGDDSA